MDAMIATIEIMGKNVRVQWSEAAEKALNKLTSPLLVEMELLFSCLIRKAVRFRQDDHPENFVSVTPQLKVRFRPVMTRACRISDLGGSETPLADFPIKKPSAFVPKYLYIDHHHGQWVGEFHIAKLDKEK
ncbi:MAG: hypothetical protein ABIT70_14495 [Sulfuriferula sp.]